MASNYPDADELFGSPNILQDELYDADLEDGDCTAQTDRLDKEQIHDLEENDLCDYFSLQFTLSLLGEEKPTFNWSKEDKVFCAPAFRPTKPPGPTLTESPGDKAVDYFNLFFNSDLIKSIVNFTNKNAKRQHDKENSQSCFEITERELKAYLGVWILIEVLYKDRLEEL